MAKFSITDWRYGYFSDSKWQSEAVDIHHVVVLRNRSNGKGFLFYILAALAFCFFILKGQSIFAVLWCWVLNVLFAKKLFKGTVEKESVMVMPNFGVQLETHYASYLLLEPVFDYTRGRQTIAGFQGITSTGENVGAYLEGFMCW